MVDIPWYTYPFMGVITCYKPTFTLLVPPPYRIHLVGGWATPLKNHGVLQDDQIPNWMEQQIFQSTNQPWSLYQHFISSASASNFTRKDPSCGFASLGTRETRQGRHKPSRWHSARSPRKYCVLGEKCWFHRQKLWMVISRAQMVI